MTMQLEDVFGELQQVNLPATMDGDLEDLIKALRMASREESVAL